MKNDNNEIKKRYQKKGKLTDITEELLDLFYYIHDILTLEIEELNRVLTFHFMEYLVIPLLVKSLLQPDDDHPKDKNCDLDDLL